MNPDEQLRRLSDELENFPENEQETGTTIGIMPYKRGIALFMDSRGSRKVNDRVFCRDISDKYQLINGSSFIVAYSGKVTFIKQLQSRMAVLVSDGASLNEARMIADVIVSEIVSSTQFQIEGFPNFGGILVGQDNDKWKAYKIGYKSKGKVNKDVSRSKYHISGSGRKEAIKVLPMGDFTSKPNKEDCLMKIKRAMFNASLRTNISGGPTKIFMLRHGRDLNPQPDHIIDPIQLHLDHLDMPIQESVLLVVVEKGNGIGQIDIIKECEPWVNVGCISYFIETTNYYVYRVLCNDAPTVTILRVSREVEDVNNILRGHFLFYPDITGGKEMQMYVQECTEDRLKFIRSLLG